MKDKWFEHRVAAAHAADFDEVKFEGFLKLLEELRLSADLGPLSDDPSADATAERLRLWAWFVKVRML